MKISDKRMKVIIGSVVVCIFLLTFGGMELANIHNEKVLKSCGYDSNKNITVWERDKPEFIEFYTEGESFNLLKVKLKPYLNNEYFNLYDSCETKKLSSEFKQGDNFVFAEDKVTNSIEGIIIGAATFNKNLTVSRIVVKDRNGKEYTKYTLFDKEELSRNDYKINSSTMN